MIKKNDGRELKFVNYGGKMVEKDKTINIYIKNYQILTIYILLVVIFCRAHKVCV